MKLKQLPGFKTRHLSKIQNGRHKQRSGQHTLARQKIYNTKIKPGLARRQFPATAGWAAYKRDNMGKDMEC